MAEMNLNFHQTLNPKVLQRAVLVGRVKIAQAIRMSETEWAKILSEVERDPLFQELISARMEGRRIIRFKRFGRTGLSSQFYDNQDVNVAGNSGSSLESLLEQRRSLLQLIEKLGREKFEKFFLYRESGNSLEEISNECRISIEEARQLEDFVLDVSVQSEFFHPSALESANSLKPTLVGRIVKNEDKTYSIAFFSPHLARGMYEIDHSTLRRWQKNKRLDRPSAARLRRYIGLLELSNLKQGAFWRVIDYLLQVQKDYLDTRDVAKMAPVSLRKVAARLQFAPSTISRVLAFKSVLLPWEREILLTHLMPGQRRVVLSIMEKMIKSSQQKHQTDSQIAKKIAQTYGVQVSRRTITACRHVLDKKEQS